jgi:hypothetical protein
LRPEVDKAMVERGSIDAETVTSQVHYPVARSAREVIGSQSDRVAGIQRRAEEFSPLSIFAPSASSRTRCRWRSVTGAAAHYDRLTAYAIDSRG